jgi:hypothetical protein
MHKTVTWLLFLCVLNLMSLSDVRSQIKADLEQNSGGESLDIRERNWHEDKQNYVFWIFIIYKLRQILLA